MTNNRTTPGARHPFKMRHLRTCSAGTVAVLTALVLPVLFGFTSLGVEVGHWYVAHRQMQGAADAAAISAAAEYIAQFNQPNNNPASTSYQGVGVNYAAANGFSIPPSNVCLALSGPDNCGGVLALDPRPIVCPSHPCIVAEITQTQSAMFLPISEPTLGARAIVSVAKTTTTTTTNGTDCILALANATNAVQVEGNGDLKANCGISIDGGIDQNASGTPLGGITFSGSNSQVNISSLTVASSSTNCPGSHCFQYTPPTMLLPASAVQTSTATPDPYAATLDFPTPPSGVQTGGVAKTTGGSGYSNGTRTFTVVGGTGTPAKFTATVSGGVVTTIGSVTDPGAYTVFPTSPVSATPDTGGGSGATFTLTEGCFTWNGTAIAGRKYCSINLNGAGTTNFPAGSYYIAGGDSNCIGFCVSSNNATVTGTGVTFYLTNGEGTGTHGTSSYATVAHTSGSISLTAPGANASTGACTGTCMLIVQNPAATASTSIGSAGTNNTFSGNGTRTMAGLIYMPRQTVTTSGNSSIGGCTGVIAKYVDVGGTPSFSNGCLPGHGIGGTTTTTTVLSDPQLSQ